MRTPVRIKVPRLVKLSMRKAVAGQVAVSIEGRFDSFDKLRVIDLFSGCGGFSEGFRQSGAFDPVAAVELNPFAAATYAENFGYDHIYCGDIAEWLASERIPAADVVVGGPPCQGFSNLGAKREDDERNELWNHYVETLVRVQPKAFVLETVDRFRKTRQFEAFCNELSEDGRLGNYRIAVDVLRATDYGSPQLRKRVIVIGTREDIAQIDMPAPLFPQDEWVDVRSAFSGIDQEIPVDRTELPEGRTIEIFDRDISGPFESSELHITRNYTELSLRRFASIPKGGNRFDLPEELKAPCWKKHESGAGDVMGRLWPERPSVTIRTEFFKPEKGRYIHPTQPRAISHYEAAVLQGFPKDFRWCGSKVEIARQIGNAVPVHLARALATHLAESLERSGAK
jgi:DNA (cytosine-5)-methyltransferase 1